MEKSNVFEFGIQTNHLDMIYEFHKTMVRENLMLIYEGEVNQSITKAFASMAENNLDKVEESSTTKNRVYHVMIECLQNICKHADHAETGEPDIPGTGIFLVNMNEDSYTITSGNVINKSKVSNIKNSLDQVNELDKDDLKQLYKKQLKESRLSDKGGAGLGFIDMARKTGNPIEYKFKEINDISSFFIMRTKINRKK